MTECCCRCTRCGKKEDPRPEPVCWCGKPELRHLIGAPHRFQPDRRKGERRKFDLEAHMFECGRLYRPVERRIADRRKAK